MPRYTPEQKSAVLRAAIAARGGGKKWSEALEAAKAVGYRGSLQGIVKMIRGGNRKAKRGRKPSKAAAPVAAKKKLGRPKGSKNAVKRREIGTDYSNNPPRFQELKSRIKMSLNLPPRFRFQTL